jgi:type II secretory pathway component PulK
MADDQDLIRALEKTASTLAGRALGSTDKDRLIQEFNGASGTGYERAIKAIQEILDVDDSEMRKKSEATDNTRRVMNDLKTTIQNWTPKK